jgi:hypothetical protein
MCAAASAKLGLFVPAALHARMQAAAAGKPRGALQDDYAAAFADLLDALDAGEPVVFAAVRGAKQRVSVRLTEALSARLRQALQRETLKITDFACAAIERRYPQSPEPDHGQDPHPARPA